MCDLEPLPPPSKLAEQMRAVCSSEMIPKARAHPKAQTMFAVPRLIFTHAECVILPSRNQYVQRILYVYIYSCVFKWFTRQLLELTNVTSKKKETIISLVN